MSEPILAVKLPAGRGRAYKHPATGDYHISVTNVIDVLAKPWLGGWAAKEVAGYAFDQREALRAMTEREAAVDFLKGAPYRKRNRAADLGSKIHEYAECLAVGEPRPKLDEVHQPYIAGLQGFIDEYQPEFEAVEVTVFSPSEPEHLRYAGTFDVLLNIGDLRFLADWKTSASIYAEVALQLAALRRGEVMWNRHTGDLSPMPAVDGCLAIHLQPDAYNVHIIDAGNAAFQCFMGLRQAWSWTKENDGAVGPRMNYDRLIKELLRRPDTLLSQLEMSVEESSAGADTPGNGEARPRQPQGTTSSERSRLEAGTLQPDSALAEDSPAAATAPEPVAPSDDGLDAAHETEGAAVTAARGAAAPAGEPE